MVASSKTLNGIGERAQPQGGVSAVNFLLLVAQLVLLAMVLRQFQIESGAFRLLALVTFAGFAVHALLPMRYRLPFFLALSLTGIVLVLGVTNAAWLIGIGLVLIGLCHVPVSFRVRALLLVAAGGILMAMRAKWLPFPWSEAIWAVLGSMFMFRLIVYFYDLSHERVPVSPTRTLSYFFMLPNVCFPLFPVVDSKDFRRNYFDQDAYRIYQVGVAWILRGTIHLILYRLVYNHLTLAPSDVADPGDLARFLVTNFGLYLRISGQFHIIVGMLYLFGFRLPETNHLYYLASSFTDFWRRINIYWKDFMLKVFYRPAYFALRKRGETIALVVATLLVFVSTWLLHSYQWFWLRGNFPLTAQDGIFWGVLAVFVIWNSLREAKYGRERTLGKTGPTWRGSLSLGMRTAVTFTVICVLWSLWTCESVSEWIAMLAVVVDHPVKGILGGVLVIAGLGVVIGTGLFLTASAARRDKAGSALAGVRRSSVTVAVTCVALLLIGSPQVYSGLGASAATIIDSLRAGHLNRLDMARMEQGYYEQLLSTERLNSQLWELYVQRPADWVDPQGVGLARSTGDFLQRELAPRTTAYSSRVLVRTNQWGMRDKEYAKVPPPGTFRLALLGSSPVMGYGVAEGQHFEPLLEERLNREPGRVPYKSFEILNFGASNYKPLQQVVIIDRAVSFSPNAVVYVATVGEEPAAARYLVQVVKRQIPIPYPELRKVVETAGLRHDMSETEALRRLRPHQKSILEWTYRYIAGSAKAAGAAAVWMQLPQPTEAPERVRQVWEEETRLARQAGFTIMSLEGAYDGRDLSTLRLAAWDNHPNALGHALIADRLYRELQDNWQPLFGGSGPSARRKPG
jgi:hypothetical protein